jgi:hypothetical protein
MKIPYTSALRPTRWSLNGITMMGIQYKKNKWQLYESELEHDALRRKAYTELPATSGLMFAGFDLGF